MEKQEFIERRDICESVIESITNTLEERKRFFDNIRVNLLNNVYSSISNRFNVDNVVMVNKFYVEQDMYSHIIRYKLKTTVFYNNEDLLV